MRPLKNRRFISLGVCAVLLAALAAAVGLIARGERVAAGVAPSSSAVVWQPDGADHNRCRNHYSGPWPLATGASSQLR